MVPAATRVLVLEDCSVFGTLLRAWLGAGPPMDVTWVGDLPQAQAALHAQAFDVVIADVDLPSGPSFDTLALARSRHPHVQIVVMTSHQRTDYAVAALRAKVDEFLFKPFTQETLAALMERLAVERQTRGQKQRRVLAIGAHPDDVEIGCAGALHRHVVRGDAVHILTLSGGEAGGAAATRAQESRAAAQVLGAELTLSTLQDTMIAEGAETIGVIEAAIAATRPDVIYTHSEHDAHQDHRNAYRATVVAARRVPSLLCYQAPSSKISFQPTHFIDITASLAVKQAAIRAFHSQAVQRAYMSEAMIEATARYWGRYAGYGLCEPFEVVRELAH